MGSLAKGFLRKVCGNSAEILRKVCGNCVLLCQERVWRFCGKFAEISRKFAENFLRWPLPERPCKWIVEFVPSWEGTEFSLFRRESAPEVPMQLHSQCTVLAGVLYVANALWLGEGRVPGRFPTRKGKPLYLPWRRFQHYLISGGLFSSLILGPSRRANTKRYPH